VGHLARRTAGLPYGGEPRDPRGLERVRAESLDGRLPTLEPAGFLHSLVRLPLANQPGAAFRYGFSTDVLGLAIERILGQRLGDALAEKVLGPLRMHETGFTVSAAQLGRMPRAFPEDKAWHGFFDMFVQADAA